MVGQTAQFGAEQADETKQDDRNRMGREDHAGRGALVGEDRIVELVNEPAESDGKKHVQDDGGIAEDGRARQYCQRIGRVVCRRAIEVGCQGQGGDDGQAEQVPGPLLCDLGDPSQGARRPHEDLADDEDRKGDQYEGYSVQVSHLLPSGSAGTCAAEQHETTDALFA